MGRNTPQALARIPLGVDVKIDTTPEATGTWTNVTPGDWDPALGGLDNFGASGVPVVHPFNPAMIYAGFDLQGLWRSVDYGRTFTKHHNPGDMVVGGKIWGLAIACDASAIWACSGAVGSHILDCLKSTDGGRSFFVVSSLGWEAYQYHASLTNPLHVLGTSHIDDHFYETLNGGTTWLDRGSVGTGGASGYVYFGLTDTTAIYVPDGDSRHAQGTRRATWNGSSWSAWSVRSTARHQHGSHQLFVDRVNGVIYNPHGDGGGGMEVSTDDGVTWSVVSSITTPQSSILAVGTAAGVPLLSGDSYASGGHHDCRTYRGTYLPATPAAVTMVFDAPQPPMDNGPRAMCRTQNAAGQQVIVSLNWKAGIWRLVL